METLNLISYDIIGAAYKVHSALGPGLLESTYEICLEYELEKMGYKVERQKPLPVIYDETSHENCVSHGEMIFGEFHVAFKNKL